MPIPVTILGGFLGAGKTTLLNHILNGEHGLRVAVLVNDFGDINIDTQLVTGVQEETINLSNGCICCTIRGDLLNATVALTQRPDPPDYIIVETSGVSEPLEVARTFANAVLKGACVVDSILTVIDAEQLRDLQGENSVLAMDQISVADMLILNKVDLVTEDELAALKREWIHEVAPTARIIETTYSQAPLELILGVGNFDPQRFLDRTARDVHVHSAGAEGDDHHHHHHDDHTMIFETWSWRSDAPLSAKALQKAIDKLPAGIYRAKGILYLSENPSQQTILQIVGKRAGMAEGAAWGEMQPYSQIVVIGAAGGFDPAELRALFEAASAENAPDGGLLGKLSGWLRGG